MTGDEGQIAYNYLDLLEAEVVNHEFEDTPIVAAVDREGGGAAIFRRTVDGKVLEFESIDHMSMLDTASNSTWDKASGLAVSGPLSGKQTRFVSLHHFLLVRLDGLLPRHRPVRASPF